MSIPPGSRPSLMRVALRGRAWIEIWRLDAFLPLTPVALRGRAWIEIDSDIIMI